ncbi:MAG: hypothetical protein ACE5KA_07470 [Nitrososphaerales archaeon]
MPTGIWFYTDDIRSTYEEQKKKGVGITTPVNQEQGDYGNFLGVRIEMGSFV